MSFDYEKPFAIRKIGDKEYQFTALSQGNRVYLEKKYPKYEGIASVIDDPDIPTSEFMLDLFHLLISEKHPDITIEDCAELPERFFVTTDFLISILNEIYEDELAVEEGDNESENPT